MNPELIQNLLFALITAIVGVIAWGLRQVISIGLLYLQKKIGFTNYELLLKNASTIVRALAQSPATELWDGEQKKQYAMNKLIQFAKGMNIDVSAEDADKLIEEAVQIMKAEIGEIDLLDSLDLPIGVSEP